MNAAHAVVERKPSWLVLAAVALALAGAWWLVAPAPRAFPPRLPGADRPAGDQAAAAVDLSGSFTAGPGVAADLPGTWPGFRGPGQSNVVEGGPALETGFPPEGPKRLWSVPLGFGYAGPAVGDGRVYLLDYDQQRQADALRCLSLADGAEIWRRSYGVKVKFNHGMSRTVPALGAGVIVTLGPKCHVLCVDAVSGDVRWSLDLVREHGSIVPPWYAGQCPLIDEGRAILAPAGPQALMIAVDCATGRTTWTAPNPMGWTMTHSSILATTLAGRKQYVYCGSGGVAGIDAADGRILWSTTAWKVDIANVPTPVPCGDDRLLLCGGYNAGSAMVRIAPGADGALAAGVLWRRTAREFGSDQQTPVLAGGNLYGVIPDGQLVCLGLDGTRLWASGAANRYGLGPYLAAGGALWLLDDAGTLSVAALSADRFERLASARVLDGHDAWGPMALAGTRLLARDLGSLVCLEVGKP